MPRVARKKKAAPKKAKKVQALAPGMQWVNPYLTVKDPAASIAFYEKAFGFKKRFAMAGPDGKIAHAELAHKTGIIMLGPEIPEQGCKAPSTLGGSPVSLYVYADDVDALVRSAQEAGANVAKPPEDMFWGDRVATVADPDGHVWSFATHVKDVAPQDMHP